MSAKDLELLIQTNRFRVIGARIVWWSWDGISFQFILWDIVYGLHIRFKWEKGMKNIFFEHLK